MLWFVFSYIISNCTCTFTCFHLNIHRTSWSEEGFKITLLMSVLLLNVYKPSYILFISFLWFLQIISSKKKQHQDKSILSISYGTYTSNLHILMMYLEIDIQLAVFLLWNVYFLYVLAFFSYCWWSFLKQFVCNPSRSTII